MNTLNSAVILAALAVPAIGGAHQPTDEDSDDLDEVVVVGRSVATSLVAIEVDREMLVDAATVLKDIPGANVNANGPVTGIAQYRGMYGDRISVVIDHLGVVSGGPNAMDTPLSYVSPMITDELVVTRGIPGVSMAPESIGGHVAARLSRGEFSESGTSLSGFAGTRFSANGNVSTTAARATLSSAQHKLSLVAEVDDGDDVDTPAGTVRPTRLHRERADLSYAFGCDSTSVLLFAGRLDTDETGTPALPMDIRFIETELAGLQVALDIGRGWSVEGRVGWNDVEHLMDNFGLREAPMPPMQRQNFTTGSGVQLRLGAIRKTDSGEFSVGADVRSAEHSATITNPNNSTFRVDNFVGIERDVASVFAEWRRAGEDSDLELGLRAKRVDAGSGTVGAAGMMGMMAANVAALADAYNAADRDLDWTSVDAVAKYRRRIGPEAEWRVEFGSKTRAPSYQELYLWLPLQATGGLADGRSYIGGLGLDEERSNEIVLGFGAAAGRVTVSPQVFYRRVDGYIQGVPSGNGLANMVSQMMSGNPALEFANVDAEIYGIDLAWKFELGGDWYLDGIASWARGKRTDVSDDLYRLAPPNASFGLTWDADRLSATAELVAYSKQDKVSIYNGEQQTPGYALVNAVVSWQPLETLQVEARLDNLLDKAYQDHVAGINRANGSDIPVGARLYGAERTLSAGLIWRF
ncbi:MAG: TonB-dependent receptor [Woeseiaceae bacterium]|nr:TonB-dependent receptor [Woeseiaceae bacterium]